MHLRPDLSQERHQRTFAAFTPVPQPTLPRLGGLHAYSLPSCSASHPNSAQLGSLSCGPVVAVVFLTNPSASHCIPAPNIELRIRGSARRIRCMHAMRASPAKTKNGRRRAVFATLNALVCGRAGCARSHFLCICQCRICGRSCLVAFSVVFHVGV
jgi:hypothetical protein